MQIFDASSIVYAWDNYPITKFPTLWNWIAGELHANTISLPNVAFDEVSHVAPDCALWLSDNGLTKIQINNAMLHDALSFKALVGVIGEAYGNGVDENDLLIIACAKQNNCRLISNEAVQINIPKKIQNCKIPAVCAMAAVRVECIDFLGFINQSNAVF